MATTASRANRMGPPVSQEPSGTVGMTYRELRLNARRASEPTCPDWGAHFRRQTNVQQKICEPPLPSQPPSPFGVGRGVLKRDGGWHGETKPPQTLAAL